MTSPPNQVITDLGKRYKNMLTKRENAIFDSLVEEYYKDEFRSKRKEAWSVVAEHVSSMATGALTNLAVCLHLQGWEFANKEKANNDSTV